MCFRKFVPSAGTNVSTWRRRARRLFLTLALGFCFCSAAGAFEDPLDSPSIKSPLAAKTMLLDVALSGDSVVAVGARGHIVRSEDNGQTWQQAEVPVRVLLTSVVFPGAGPIGWAVGHQGVVLVSYDSGKTWTKQMDGRQAHQLMVDAFAEAVDAKSAELEKAEEEDRELLELELEDLTFSLDDSIAYVEEGPNRPFLDVWFRDESEGFAVGAFGLIVQTVDGGKTWSSPAGSIPNPEAFHLNAVCMIGDVLYLAGEAGTAWRSLDGGQSWEVLDTGYNGSFFALAGDQGGVVLLGMRGSAYLSYDRGESWGRIASNFNANLYSGLTLPDGRLLVAQNRPQLLISDADRSSLLPLNLKVRGAVSSMVFGKDGSLYFVGTAGIHRIAEPVLSSREN